MATANKTPAPVTPTATPAPAAAPKAPVAKAPVTKKAAVKKPSVTKTAVTKKTPATPKPAAGKKAAVSKTAAVPKPVNKPAAKPAAAPKAEKTVKAKKPKLVRDSFTIPKAEYLVLEELKQRATALARPIKKSELLRAGIKALAALNNSAFLAALDQVPAIKTGRPAA